MPLVGDLEYFDITNDTNALVGNWKTITIEAMNSNNQIIWSNRGSITVYVDGASGNVTWSNTNACLTDNGDHFIYDFDCESGPLIFYIKDTIADTVNIEVRSANTTTATDDDTEGDLIFWSSELGYFVIEYTNSPGQPGIWESFIISAKTIDGYHMDAYDGTITISAAGTSEVEWQNPGTGCGTLSTNGDKIVYTFGGICDGGTVEFNIRSDCENAVEVEVISAVTARTDDDTEGKLDFFSGTIYYVDDNDNTGDTWTLSATGNDGTGQPNNPAQPYATIQYVINTYTLNPGDKVLVDTGTHAPASINEADNGSAAGGRVTFTGSTQGIGAIIDSSGGAIGFNLGLADYIRIENFKINGGGTGNIGIQMNDCNGCAGANYNYIYNNEIYGHSGWGIFNRNSDFNIIYGNEFYNNNIGITVENTSTDVVICRNYIHDNAGVSGFGTSITFAANNTFYAQNLFDNNAGNGWQLGNSQTLKNNTSINHTGNAHGGGGSHTFTDLITAGNNYGYNMGSGNTVNYSCAWDTTAANANINGNNFTNSTYNSIIADPLFVNAGAGDYRLQPDSPCQGTASDGLSSMGRYTITVVPANPSPGSTNSYAIHFVTTYASTILDGAIIHIQFHSDFDLSLLAGVTGDIGAGGASVNGQLVIVTNNSGGDIVPNSTVSIALSNIINPLAFNTYEIDMKITDACGNMLEDWDKSNQYEMYLPPIIMNIIKTVDETNAYVGDTLTYKIVVSNTNLQDGTGIEIIDLIPAGSTYVLNSLKIGTPADDWNTAPIAPTDTTGDDEACYTNNQVIFCVTNGIAPDTGGTIPIGENIAVFFKVTVNGSSGPPVKLTGTPFGTLPPFAAGMEPDKAVDGNLSTFYHYSQQDNGFVGIDLGPGGGNESQVGKIRYYPRPGTDRMNGGIFEGSTTSSNSGYTTLYTIPVEPPDAWTAVTISVPGAFRWLRYRGLNGYDSYSEIVEMEFFSPSNYLASGITNEACVSGDNLIESCADAGSTVSPISPTIIGFSPSSGSIGTTINITGTGFNPVQGTGVVWIDGQQAFIDTWTTTNIIAVVVPGTVTGLISVTNSDNLGDTTSSNFNVIAELVVRKSVTNISIGVSSISGAIPGSSVAYAIHCSAAMTKATNALVYDQLPGDSIYMTNTPPAGWTPEFSTNTGPDQDYASGHYGTTPPAIKSNLKWIRWKNPSLNADETAILIYKVLIK